MFNIMSLWYIYFRGKDEEDSDIQELIMSFAGLEEKVLEQYTFAKVWHKTVVSIFYLEESRREMEPWVEKLLGTLSRETTARLWRFLNE